MASGASALALLAALAAYRFAHAPGPDRLGRDDAPLIRVHTGNDGSPGEPVAGRERGHSGPAAVVAGVDAVSGELREPDSEPRRRLAAAVRDQFAGYGLGDHLPTTYANGMISYVWGGLSVSLARIHGDGHVETDCVSSPEHAATLIEEDAPRASRRSRKPEM